MRIQIIISTTLLTVGTFVTDQQTYRNTYEHTAGTVSVSKKRTTYSNPLAACRSEIFGFGKSMSIPIDA